MRFLSAISLISFLYTYTANCQITITQDMTAEQYVNDILLGEGITASNVEFTGDSLQFGHMTEGYEIPIENGLILSSALATNPMTCELDEAGILTNGVDGEPDLLTVANSVPPLIGQSFSVSSVNDVCILEFDFEASGDSISFNYIFGSDEYLAWVNSSYNDIFAFFLSGPGITGPFASPAGFPDGAINIAQVPNSDPELPITISSVNNVTNPEYYIDNNPNNEFICINGYTQIFTASSQVQCGETYHIKLAIADGSDDYLESFVILQEGSFSSNAIDLIANASIEGAEVFLGDTTVVEGCNDATFTVVRPDDSELDTIFLSIDPSSTALPGSDYNADIEMVIMQPGQSSANISLGVINDSIPEGPEFVTLQYEYINGCGDTTLASATIVIFDSSPISLITDPVGCLDENDGITLSVEPVTGYGPFSYQWYTDSTQPISIEPSFYYDTGGITGEAVVEVIDVCGNIASDTIPWSVWQPLTWIGDTLTVCYGESGTIDDIVEGGTWVLNNEDDTVNVFSEILALEEPSDDDSWVNIIGNNTINPIIYVLGMQDVNTGLYYGNFLTDATAASDIGDVTLELTDGCGDTTIVVVKVEYCELHFCNVFSPDQNGGNDNFRIQNLQDFMLPSIYIYDRWGQLVFEDTNFKGTWDGRNNFEQELADGVYYYVLRINYNYDEDPELENLYNSDEYYFVNVTKSEPGVVEFMGNVSIFRE